MRSGDGRPLGNSQVDVAHQEKSKSMVGDLLGSTSGKHNLGDSSAATQEEVAYTKEETAHNTLQDDCRHRNHTEGNNLNGGVKAVDGQAFIGEEERYAMQSPSPSLLGQIPQQNGPACIKGPIAVQGGCNKENNYPAEFLGMNEVQNQKGVG